MENFNDVTAAFTGWLQPLEITRTSGSYVDGRWNDGAPVSIEFNAVVQNATPDDLKVLEEGNRTEEAIKLHTAYPLIAQNESAENGDIINYNSKNWMVYNVASRKIGGYYKAIAIRID